MASPALYPTGKHPGACWTYRVPFLTTEYSGPECVCHPLLDAGFNSFSCVYLTPLRATIGPVRLAR